MKNFSTFDCLLQSAMAYGIDQLATLLGALKAEKQLKPTL